MGILSAISKAKEKFREQQKAIRSRKSIRQAKKLESLREKRIYEEGQAKLRSMEARERSRISKAKMTQPKRGFGGNLKKSLMSRENKFELGRPEWSSGKSTQFGVDKVGFDVKPAKYGWHGEVKKKKNYEW